MDYAALKAELMTDPAGLGYAPHMAAGTDWALADLMNAVSQSIDIPRTVIASYEIINATTPSEWTLLTAAEKQRYQTLTGAGSVDVSNANVRAAFQAMFPQATTPTTRAALAALVSRKGSRSELLFGQTVSVADISKARAA